MSFSICLGLATSLNVTIFCSGKDLNSYVLQILAIKHQMKLLNRILQGEKLLFESNSFQAII